MELSQAGFALIKKSEGFRSHVYLDVAGFPTIGYGHKCVAADSFPGGIDEPMGAHILNCDVQDAEKYVVALVFVPLTQGQFDALVDFVFNLGPGRLASSTLLRDLNAGNYDAAAEQLLRWDHAGAQENTALKARRQAEFNLWQGSGISGQGSGEKQTKSPAAPAEVKV